MLLAIPTPMADAPSPNLLCLARSASGASTASHRSLHSICGGHRVHRCTGVREQNADARALRRPLRVSLEEGADLAAIVVGEDSGSYVLAYLLHRASPLPAAVEIRHLRAPGNHLCPPPPSFVRPSLHRRSPPSEPWVSFAARPPSSRAPALPPLPRRPASRSRTAPGSSRSPTSTPSTTSSPGTPKGPGTRCQGLLSVWLCSPVPDEFSHPDYLSSTRSSIGSFCSTRGARAKVLPMLA